MGSDINRQNRNQRHRLYILDELTIVPFLLYAARGKKPVLLFSNPLIRVLIPFFIRLETRLRLDPRVRSLENVFPDFPHEANFSKYSPQSAAVHRQTDEAFCAAFDKIAPDGWLAEYIYPLRKALSAYSEKVGNVAYLAQWLKKTGRAADCVLYGAPTHLDLATHREGQSRGGGLRRTAARLVGVFNFLNVIASVLGGLGWLARRLHFRPLSPITVRLAVDKGTPIDLYMVRQVIDDPDDVVFVYRNAEFARKNRDADVGYRGYTKEDARISIRQLGRLAVAMGADLISFWRSFRWVDPVLFGSLTTLPVKRAMFAAFFSRIQPRFYWGRDDYSIDHVIRNQELRKIGGVAMGISHGLPLETLILQWREIDFDIYYTFGTHLYETYYKNTWAKHIRVKPIGSFNLTREYRARLKTPRPNDIAFFPVTYDNFEDTIAQAFKVANHFRDRRVFIKMKAGRPDASVQIFRQLMAEAPINVIVQIDPNPYELLFSVSYSVAFTTMVAESLQFGVKTFTLDNLPHIESNYLHDFPTLVVRDGDQLIKRIEAIESGREAYNFEQFSALVRKDGPDLFDVIRRDIGL